MRDHSIEYAAIAGISGIVVWGSFGFLYWVNHPELTYMQVWLKMVGL